MSDSSANGVARVAARRQDAGSRRIRIAFGLCVSVLLGCLSPPKMRAVDLVSQRHAVEIGSHRAWLPYRSSQSLDVRDETITRVMLSIHSSGFDANQYFENAKAVVSKATGASAETLIIAPQFLQASVLPDVVPDGMLYWRSPPYRGSSRAAISPGERAVSFSAMDLLDGWLATLVAGETFPNVRDVVLVGHSAGGQFVQRYAMVGRFEPPQPIRCRYVVSAPSSYAYPSGERYDASTRSFRLPTDSERQSCPRYNEWGYGLEKPYTYFASDDADEIARRYGRRSVFYLCGAKDTDAQDPSLGTSCGAMRQGRHRLERMQVFLQYLAFMYGRGIRSRQSGAVVPGVGHWGRGNMTSPAGVKFLLAPIR